MLLLLLLFWYFAFLSRRPDVSLTGKKATYQKANVTRWEDGPYPFADGISIVA